jgi:beta-phosphoglucomutase-like phosphatase (HAD superfamily)|tara:strand:- start:870 stop:1457 length:588 start_codon:yes stop_codon:yes gene_type:complete
MKPQGLIFDCDGTLVDSMPLHWRAWDTVCKRHGIKFSEKRHYAMGGIPSRKILAILKEEQGLDFDPLQVSNEKEEAYLPLMPQVGLIEPVIAIAREHRGRIPMAVATGGRTQFIRPLLERLKIADWFSALVTSDDVTNPKPAPDTFLKAAALLGIPAEECRAFEDTDLGMESIHAAGMDAVDVREIPGVLPESAR